MEGLDDHTEDTYIQNEMLIFLGSLVSISYA